ncbi:MAG: zinc-ribbon domain-containing protein [Lentimicrobium sp.]|jgi:hypothetical protein|nr:zinc-ribbon domain-containing protein [Lentimicrobium sp.]
MRNLLFTFFLSICFSAGFSQAAFRLHVQPGKPQLYGDGDDFTTLVITARDSEGEVITSMSGKVKIGVSSGFPDETEVNMQSGVALVKFTAPMFGTPVKSSQRMVYFIFRFMQKFMARATGSADENENRKLATDVALDTFKEGLNPLTLIPKSEGDNFVYIVCEMNGIKGKAKIEISKVTDGRNGNIVPGVYYGRDITGQSEWMLDITSGGEGYFGEANASSRDQVAILFSNEDYAEFNDAMGKMAGMTGFKKAYLGPPASEQKYYENFDIRTSGMSSAYMPMPNHGVFVYIPPILFEYAGRRSSDDSRTGGSEEKEVKKTEKTGIVLKQNQIVGDGRSRTQAIFHYEDENGVPVRGKSISWAIPDKIKLISSETVTDANGNAVAILEAPLLQATEEKRGEMTGEIIDNYDLFRLKVSYSSNSGKQEYTETTLSVYKVIEKNMFVLKPGLEPLAFKALLPQLERFTLESGVFAMVEMLNSPSIPDKVDVNDAIVMICKRKFDQEYFQRNYDLYFKKDRPFFLTMMDSDKGGFCAITSKNGRFKITIGGNTDKKLSIEPIQAKIADLSGRRAGSLGDALKQFSDTEFINRVITDLFNMEKSICTGSASEAWYVEEKLHVIGMLMTNTKSSSLFMKDTGKELVSNAWSVFSMTWDLVNEKFKVTEKLSKKIGMDKVSDSLMKIGMRLDRGLWSYASGTDQKSGTRRMIIDLLRKNILSDGSPDKIKASVAYYRLLGNSAGAVSGEVFKKLTEGIANALSGANPVPDLVVNTLNSYFYEGLQKEILHLLDQSPDKIHQVYPQLQPALHDRSAEIRSGYQGIATTRFNTEMYKADWDLFRDVVVKGGIIIYDIKTLKWHQLKTHMENIDKFNKVTDLAYTTTNLTLELYRYHWLWCEASAVFIYTNKCIDQGNVATALNEKPEGFNLFQEVYAVSPAKATPVTGIAGISGLDYSLKGGRFPVENINKAIEARGKYNEWVNSDNLQMAYFTGIEPVLAANLYKTGFEFESQTTALLLDALAYAENRSMANQHAFNKTAAVLTKTSAALADATGKAQTMIEAMPARFDVPVQDIESINAEIKIWKNPLYQKIAAGLLVAAVLIFVVGMLVRIRKKRKMAKADSGFTGVTPMQVENATLPPATPSAVQGKMKFCTKCGAPLKPGAKFCGKCGYHL